MADSTVIGVDPAAALRIKLAGTRMSSLTTWLVAGGATAVGVLMSIGVMNFGPAGTLVVTGPIVIAATWAASRLLEDRRTATNRLMTMLVTFSFAVALLPLISVMWQVLSRGLARFDMTFFTTNMRGVVGEGGGMLHALLGTLIITGATAVISIPVGVLSAIYLVEYGRGPLARGMTVLVDVMTGIPSIVAGLFAYALFLIFFGPGVRIGIGAAVALSLLMIPIVVRSTEEMLKLVPSDLREASVALGAPKWRTVVQVVLPAAAAGISAGVIVAIARVIGETAPLLIIAGNTTSTNTNLFSGRMETLPVFTYYSYRQPGVPPSASIDRAWAAALTLMLLVMILNLIARLIARALAPKTA
jgi:phosphate transport system permease protein